MAKQKIAAEKEIIKLYQKGFSMGEIAKKIGVSFSQENWYSMKVQRVLKNASKRGLVKIRDASAAQKLALESGRSKHPTEGRERTDEERNKISDGMDKYLDGMTDEETKDVVDNRVRGLKKRWGSLSNKERSDLLGKMKVGRIELLSTGSSKLEGILMSELRNRGYSPVPKYKINREASEIDIYLDKTHAIEIDGPTHFMPIYGEESLKKTLTKDKKKDKILIGAGIRLMRIQVQRSSSIRLINKLADKIDNWVSTGKRGLTVINTKDI